MENLKERIDLLSYIARRILGNEDLNSTATLIMETLRTHLNAYGGGLFFPDEYRENVQLFTYTEEKFIDRVVKAIPGNMYSYKFPVNSDEVLISKCFRENKIIQAPLLTDFFYPVIPALPLNTIQRFTKLQLCIGIPIEVDKKVIGVLFAVFQKASLSPLEMSLLQFYANLSGLAIDSNRKLAEINKRYELERETTALLSHELKTPIAMTYYQCQTLKLILDRYQKELGINFDDLNKLQEKLQASIEHMDVLCHSILRLREVESKVPEKKQKINLEEFLSQVVRNFEREAKSKKLKFSYNCNIRPGSYLGRGIQFEQILTILLDNAVKYTKEGSIDVDIGLEDNNLVCRITDTGIGIPMKDRQQVFDRFYKSNTNQKGLGLGLYIAKKIAKDLGGDIIIADNPNAQGTEFTVSIPVT